MVLRSGELVLLAVDRPAARGEDHPSHPVPHTILQQTHRPEDVDIGIEIRLQHRAADIYVGGLVWQRTSGRSSWKTFSQPERTSSSEKRAPSGTFSRLPLERSSTTMTSWLRSRKRSATCEPINPAPPVSRIRTSGDLANVLARPGEPAQGF